MNYRSLADFLEDLRELGEMDRIDDEIDPAGEAAELVRKTAREKGSALLFTALRSHDLPVAVNLFVTEERICRGLGVAALADLTERIERIVSPPESKGVFSRLIGSSPTITLDGIAPRTVKSAACQQIVRLGGDVDLTQLPLLQSDACEKQRTMPAAPLVTCAPDSRRVVSGRFDLQLIDRQRLAVCLDDCDEPARLWREYRRRNEKMPLAIVLGGEPVFMLASAAVLPGDLDACSLAGLFRGKPLDVVACRTVDLAVPAEAEIVLEGYFDPQNQPIEAGPMLSPVGEPTAARMVPAMHVAAVTQRANPVYPAVVYGPPPHEASAIGRAMARVFLPVVKAAIEELVDYDLPEFGASRFWATLSIRKNYAAQVRRVVNAAWSMKTFRRAKWLAVVDEAIDVRDAAAVMAAVAAHADPLRDVWTQRDVCERIAIDATRK
jgi:4-hydroxy-3-polyprenylbenzoate decarboxylase